MNRTEQIRQWLSVVLGPTARVEAYSPEYVWQRFRDMWGFYGVEIMSAWGAPPLHFTIF